jgi:hypothetical protein
MAKDVFPHRNTKQFNGKCIIPRKLRNLGAKKRAFKAQRSPGSKQRYVNCQKQWSALVKDLAVQAERRVIKEGNPTALFKYVKKQICGGRSIPPLQVNGGAITEEVDKANVLNNCFSENFTLDNGVMPPMQNRYRGTPCKVPLFTPSTVLGSLLKAKPSDATGPDGFSANFYREIKHEICLPLSWIYNASLKQGMLPSVWKTANVVPVFKKGDAANPKNYRPIALTCVPCKIMERVIRTSMLDFFQGNKLLSDDQFGFLPAKSTVLQLLTVLDEWTFCVDNGIPVDVILVDFAKAFESVSHPKLLAKLTNIGIQGSLANWLKDFLTGRSQRVVVGSSHSGFSPVVSGVPQGSVLGPLLFLIFINDLQLTSPCPMYKFADDVKVHSTCIDEADRSKLNSAVSELENWSSRWQLPLAPSKCSVFHIGRRNLEFDYKLCSGVNLNHTKVTKDLGVWLTHDLKSSTHCNNIVKTAFQRAALIKKVFCSGDRNTLVWAFKVFVRPILEYASPVWSPAQSGDILHVELVQRRFTKYLPGLRSKSYQERLKILGLETLEMRRIKADLSLTYSLLHNLLDFDYAHFFEINTNGRTRGHAWKLVVNASKRDVRKNFFAHRVINIWNNLPGYCVEAPSIVSFKRELAKLSFNEHLTIFEGFYSILFCMGIL